MTTKVILSQYGVSSDIIASTSNNVLIDSGAASHVFKTKTVFTQWDNNFDPRSVALVMADGTICSNIRGKGTVKIHLTDSSATQHQIILKNVFYMPSLNHQGIVSVRQANLEGIRFGFNEKVSHMIIGKVKIPLQVKDRLYFINSLKNIQSAARTAVEWHNILGHPNFEDLYKMPKGTRGMVITHSNKTHCDACNNKKQ